jgi:hypothetical protein
MLSNAAQGETLLPGNADSASLAAAGGGAPGAPGGVVSDEWLVANQIELHSKLLSLDLLLEILVKAGPALRNGPKFIAAIKMYLCVGLLKNFVSSIPALSKLSLRTFMALVKNFRRHVTAETEVFISQSFMRILTSTGAFFFFMPPNPSLPPPLLTHTRAHTRAQPLQPPPTSKSWRCSSAFPRCAATRPRCWRCSSTLTASPGA